MKKPDKNTLNNIVLVCILVGCIVYSYLIYSNQQRQIETAAKVINQIREDWTEFDDVTAETDAWFDYCEAME